jgi:hypothetical protein
MGGSTDAFALYLSLFQVSRPTDASKPSTSLAFHKEAEEKFEFGTSNLKNAREVPKQEELLSYEDLKKGLDEEKERGKVELETEVLVEGRAGRGRRLGGEDGAGAEAEEGEKQAEVGVGARREMALRAAERRAEQAKEVQVQA